MEEVVAKNTHGIDLHTGAVHRDNYPQIRGNLDDRELERLAATFGVPVLINAGYREGSLRSAAADLNVPVLVYEAGEALRFDEVAIRGGVNGIVRVMRELGMLRHGKTKRKEIKSAVGRSSTWVRAPQSGVLRTVVPLGSPVAAGRFWGSSVTRSGARRSRSKHKSTVS